MKNITSKLQEAHANTIYDLTGCLASCDRKEYAKLDGILLKKYDPYKEKPELHLKFKITEASYKEEEQYVIYDFNNFVGESGGILGLVLGYSILGLYDDLANTLRRFKLSSLFN